MVNITELENGGCRVQTGPLYEQRLYIQIYHSILFGLWLLSSIPILVLAFLRRNHPFMKKHHFPFLINIAFYLGITGQMIIEPLRVAIGIPNFSCITFLVFSQMIVPFFGMGLFLRILLFSREAERAIMLEKVSYSGFASYFESNKKSGGLFKSKPRKVAATSDLGFPSEDSQADDVTISSPHTSTTGRESNADALSVTHSTARMSDLGSIGRGSTRADMANLITEATRKSQAFYVIPIIIVTVTAALTGSFLAQEEYRRNCLGCVLDFTGSLIFFGEIIVLTLLMIYAFRKARAYSDPLNIKREILLSIVVGAPFGLFGLLIGGIDPALLGAENRFRWGIFQCIGLFTSWLIQIIPPLRETYKRSGRIEENQSLLKEILRDPVGMEAFRKHLVQEHSAELIRFMTYAKKWKSEFSSLEGNSSAGNPEREKKRIMFAIELFKLFIHDDAPLFVNVGHELREPILDAFSFLDEGKSMPDSPDKIPITIFDRCLEDTQEMLENDSLPRFKKTDAYKKWAGIDTNSKQKETSRTVSTHV